MPLFTSAEREFVTALGHLTHCNPFLPQGVLSGNGWREAPTSTPTWPIGTRGPASRDHANLAKLIDRSSKVLDRARDRLAKNFARVGDDLPSIKICS